MILIRILFNGLGLYLSYKIIDITVSKWNDYNGMEHLMTWLVLGFIAIIMFIMGQVGKDPDAKIDWEWIFKNINKK